MNQCFGPLPCTMLFCCISSSMGAAGRAATDGACILPDCLGCCYLVPTQKGLGWGRQRAADGLLLDIKECAITGMMGSAST